MYMAVLGTLVLPQQNTIMKTAKRKIYCEGLQSQELRASNHHGEERCSKQAGVELEH